jgi:hypothetical protein
VATATAASWVFAMLLIVAGAGKVTRPEPTSVALRQARLPAGARLVRTIGGGEIILGGLALLPGGTLPMAGLVTAYAVLALVARRQQRAGADCGCFGTGGAPVTSLHVGVDWLAAAIGLVAAVAPGPSVTAILAARPWPGLVALTLAATAAAALRLLLTGAPDLTAAIALHEPDGTA